LAPVDKARDGINSQGMTALAAVNLDGWKAVVP
jgi:hypothetical protein